MYPWICNYLSLYNNDYVDYLLLCRGPVSNVYWVSGSLLHLEYKHYLIKSMQKVKTNSLKKIVFQVIGRKKNGFCHITVLYFSDVEVIGMIQEIQKPHQATKTVARQVLAFFSMFPSRFGTRRSCLKI